jgi:type VI secretion system lysozyme-like protein
LFERLLDAGPGGSPGRVAADDKPRSDVEVSVAREVGALLNTRVAPEIDHIEPADRTVIEYGLPDATALSPKSEADRDQLASAIERAIRAFEPRLANPRVTVFEERTERGALALAISGTLTYNSRPTPFAFDLALSAEPDADVN